MHAQDELNLRIFRMFEGTFSNDAAPLRISACHNSEISRFDFPIKNMESIMSFVVETKELLVKVSAPCVSFSVVPTNML